MARQMDYYFTTEGGERVSVLDLGRDGPYHVWNHQHAVSIGEAGTEYDALQMING